MQSNKKVPIAQYPPRMPLAAGISEFRKQLQNPGSRSKVNQLVKEVWVPARLAEWYQQKFQNENGEFILQKDLINDFILVLKSKSTILIKAFWENNTNLHQ